MSPDPARIAGFYKFARGLVKIIVQGVFGLRVLGSENVPSDGPLIVVANHISNADPPILGSALNRPVSYMAKKELYFWPLGPLIGACGAYAVDRQAGGTAALRASLRMLKEGRAIGIFPEGGRNVDGAKEAKAGAAFLAATSGAPVIPAYIGGTRSLRPGRPVTVVFGRPFRVVRNRQAGDGDLEKWAEEIMMRIHALEESIR